METKDSKTKWYAIRTISGQEKKVKQYIESEIKRLSLDSDIEKILIPVEKVYIVRNGKKRTQERSFLPGYIFVEAQLLPETQQAIKEVPGVVGFLGMERGGKFPIPLREAEIKQILGKVDELKAMDEVLENPFIIGEMVKVIDGPFNGFTGAIDKVSDEKKKVTVKVKIFGRETPLELNYLQVERSQ